MRTPRHRAQSDPRSVTQISKGMWIQVYFHPAPSSPFRSLWAIGTGPGGVGRERSERRGRGRMTKRGASLQALRKGLSITASADSRKEPEGGKVGIVLVL